MTGPSEAKSHIRLCDLVERHCEKHKDWIILRNYIYHEGGKDGEVDVLAATKYGFVFYEIKSTHMAKRYHKATEQFSRFYQSHKRCGQHIIGVYVTPTCVKRIRRLYD